ncbi:hypothetical protein RB195_022270 [Necator americanus]|uniref:Uncharacterized protein n=1 Tax=Necator americanus TaxID=51031 RepID=A0ABR1EEX8_NECAM
MSTCCTAIENGYRKSSSFLYSRIKQTGRSPCSTSFEDLSWKKPPGRKRKFWIEMVKEDPRTLGVDRQFRRDVRFRRIWDSDERIDSVQALAGDREGWADLCSRTAHLGEDVDNRVRRCHQPAD